MPLSLTQYQRQNDKEYTEHPMMEWRNVQCGPVTQEATEGYPEQTQFIQYEYHAEYE